MLPNQKRANHDQETEVIIDSTVSKTEHFIENNGKKIIVAIAAIVLVVGGFYGYKHLWMAPQMEKAADMMFVAEQQFAVDSFKLALNGDGNNAGFIDVIDQYGSTPQGNIANHYAGICYLKLKDFDNALKYFAQYDNTKGVPNEIINAQNKGLVGDIYSQKGDMKRAASSYMEAVAVSDNDFTAPYYLKKAGLAYTKLGDNNEALKAYQMISDKYPASMEARDIDKFIGQLEQK